MSVVFSSYSGKSTNKNGYFRIGTVILDIPPSDIITDRISNNNRKQVLRGRNEMFTKSGQSRWDVTISWVALIDHEQANPYKQWEDLQTIVAMFKAAPFVEVENAHLRQIFAKQEPTMAAAKLAFGLRQLKIETHQDIVDGLIVTLTMTYFNYKPYSLAFNYDKTQLATYLSNWVSNNLKNKDSWFHVSNWKDQLVKETGKVGINWKRYKAITIAPPGLDQTVNSTAANTTAKAGIVNPSLIPTPSYVNGSISASNLALLTTLTPAASSAAIAWLTAVSSNGYSYTVTSAKRRTKDSDPGTGTSQTALYAAYQAAGGAAMLGKPGGPTNLVAPPGHSKHETGTAVDITFQGNAAFNFAYTTAGQYGFAWTYGLKDKVHWDYTGQISPTVPTKPIMSSSTVAKNGNQIHQDLGTLTSIGPEMQQLINDGWVFDYITEDTAYFFMPESIILRDKQHEHLPHAKGLQPTQLSLLFVNNLAQIPLANYQYPTYQQIGPASSLLSIQITSNGEVLEAGGEPQHQGLSQLTSMSHIMEEQFFDLRTHFRSVKSIHGMQAVFIENAILNMLGVFGVLPEQLSTEIVRDSSNMVQVNFMAHQYENIYEETPAYKINGITGAYVTATKNIIAQGSLTKLSANEQTQLTKVIQFQNDYNSLNSNNLGGWICNAATLSSNGNFIDNFSNNPTITLTVAQATAVSSIFTYYGNKYPGLSVRVNSINKTSNCTYADYLAAKYLAPQTVQNSVSFVSANLDATINNQISNVNPIVSSIYLDVLPYISNADSVFASQLQKLANSPIYKTQFQAQANASNPSEANTDHGAYQDLGLGDTLNPDSYFTNDQDKYHSLLLKSLGNTASQISNNANNIEGLNNTSNTVVSSTTGIPTDPNKLIKMINTPGYTMGEAFPTFKLFFLEDANAGIYYAFDSFYSYNSVLEMEIIRPTDKPSTAVIRLTNLSNLFDHKIFDNTMVGKHEAKLATFTSPSDNTEEVTTNTTGTSKVYGRNPITGTITGRDLREGFDPANPKLIPLKYFPLQTGTKIQVRFGFENDPDKLTPVFNGLVTEIEPGEEGELIITAQSFLLELTTVSGVSATNSKWSIDELLDIGVQPAYGGLGIFNDNGDVQTVIKQLLSNPAAKHFGHWQLNGSAPDQLLKGYGNYAKDSYGWQALAGSVASTLGYTNASAIINNAYDRSGENIMINNYIDFTGTMNAGRGVRSFQDQSSSATYGSIWTVYRYYVANDLDMSIWDLIKDVSRRYPEYVLLEKFYGFPYEADSTLVFGSPLDWYYTRPSLIGDDEILRAADSNGALYHQWFETQGRQILTDAITNFIIPKVNSLSFVFGSTVKGYVNQASVSYSALQTVSANLITLVEASGIPLTNSHAEDVNQAKSVLASIDKAYIAYVSIQTASLGSGQINDDRIKPIRKYHLIDNQSIIHNGIKLNDKIYNVIKIIPPGKSGKTIKANSNIPEHHVRLLDVTSRINDPLQNVDQADLYQLVGQSFLKEEMGKMYRGELILRGIPELEPMDVLILMDPSTGIVGPVEVDQVIHSFTQEMGFITIVKPRCVITINETLGAKFYRSFGIAMSSVLNSLNGNIVNSQASLNVALVLAGGFCYWSNTSFADNPIVIQPLFRYNRPWVGGLEGFKIAGFTGTFSAAWDQLVADEYYPLLDLYKTVNKITS